MRRSFVTFGTLMILPNRVFLTVLDSVGIGELPDAGAYGDEGSNTVRNISPAVPLQVPALRSLGLGNVVELLDTSWFVRRGSAPMDAWRRSQPVRTRSRATGKSPASSSSAHFLRFPTDSREVVAEFERRIGRPTIGKYAASGTAIIDELGPEHMRTGLPIVYTSADSVFEIAAHEEIIPIAELYRICEIAYKQIGKGMNIGRVIARPFVGRPAHSSGLPTVMITR